MTIRTRPPVFVLGAPRSGTTALYKALCLHPAAAWLSNWERRVPRLTAPAAVNRIPALVPRLRRDVWFGVDGRTAYAYGTRRRVVHRLFPQPVEGEPVFAAAGFPTSSDDGRVTARQLRLRGQLARRQRWSGGQVFVSKRIAHNTRVPLLHAVFPDARFVVITRDGRAVASSLQRVDWWTGTDLWWYGGTPEDWVEAGGSPLEASARHWLEEVRAIEHGLSAVPPDQVLSLRYEELVRSSRSILRAVAEFGGLEASATWDRALDAVAFPNQNDTWREHLGGGVDLVEQVQGDELRRLAYL